MQTVGTFAALAAVFVLGSWYHTDFSLGILWTLVSTLIFLIGYAAILQWRKLKAIGTALQRFFCSPLEGS